MEFKITRANIPWVFKIMKKIVTKNSGFLVKTGLGYHDFVGIYEIQVKVEGVKGCLRIDFYHEPGRVHVVGNFPDKTFFNFLLPYLLGKKYGKKIERSLFARQLPKTEVARQMENFKAVLNSFKVKVIRSGYYPQYLPLAEKSISQVREMLSISASSTILVDGVDLTEWSIVCGGQTVEIKC